ncbi:hypothetical protein CJF30_00001140 [Rutstroemia sp. NJR-2017a BBW]|nr:hypothetical protein CJF30_00001140 [Rutstroemia sp. NJR-2017a BBW]
MSSDAPSRSEEQVQKFPLFPKLPLEIQRMIWEEACDLPNVIVVMWHLGRYLPRPRQYLTREAIQQLPLAWSACLYQKIPAVLNICVESRKIARRRYSRFYTRPYFSDTSSLDTSRISVYNDIKKLMYINFSADTLVFPDWQSPLLLCPYIREPDVDSALDFVQHIVIGNPDVDDLWRAKYSLISPRFAAWYPGLKSLRAGHPRGPLTKLDREKGVWLLP